jgi:4-amino-4-deoxy-L-arabinose transferase-like glycosyltransferase
MDDAAATGPSPRNIRVREALAVAAVAFGLMVATEPSLAIVWDEGYTLGRVERVRSWVRLLIDPSIASRWVADPPGFALVQPDREDGRVVPRPDVATIGGRGDLFRADVLAWFWPFAREEPHGHPPFYALVALVGDVVTPWREPLGRARLGPMLAFAFAGAVLYRSVARTTNRRLAGLAACGAWLIHPHLFALGHYAHYDALLASLTVGMIASFARAVECPTRGRAGWAWAAVFGSLLGAAMATKFTGWLLPVPFAAWVVLRLDFRAAPRLAFGMAIGCVVALALTPPFWPDPIGGVARFLESNLTRGRTIPLPVLFLGRVFRTPLNSLPWYNTLLLTAATTPVVFLFLGILGAIWTVRRAWNRSLPREPLAEFALLVWGFFLVLRALPHTPGHDGIRLFLPGFAGLAVLVGVGASRAVGRWGRVGRNVIVAGLAEAGVGLALAMPMPLSYFSPAVGGLAGASRIGLETTYYWDALTPEALDWLNRSTPATDKVRFSTYPLTLVYLRQTGRLRPEPIRYDEAGPTRWYVILNRGGMLRPEDGAILSLSTPSFAVRRAGVILLGIYPDGERERNHLRSEMSPTTAPTSRSPSHKSPAPGSPPRD